MRLLAIGHSHLETLQAAAEQQGGARAHFLQLREPSFKPVFLPEPPRVLNPAIARAIGTSTANSGFDATLLYLFGNTHNLVGLFEVDGPLAPGPLPPEVDAAARVYIPQGVLKASFEARMARWLRLMRLLKPLAVGRLVVLEPPPPLPEEQVREAPGAFREFLSQYAVAPAWVRFTLWRMQTAVLREACATQGIHFVPVPEDVQREDGLLKREFCGSDPTHGNSAYGVRVLAHLRATLT